MNGTILFFTLLATIIGMIVWLKNSLTAQFNERFNTIDERFNSFDKRLTRLEADHDKLGNKIDMLAGDMTDIRERLARVEAKLDIPPNIDPGLPPIET